MVNRLTRWANPKPGKTANFSVTVSFAACLAASLATCLVTSTAFAAPANDSGAQEKMLRIAEVLGSLHFLRNLCGEKSQIWREQMDELIAKENPAENERLRLISNFNRGYRGYSDTYTRCTPSALAAINSYLKEGAALSKELVSRYGN